MPNVRLDHLLTFANVASIDDYVAKYHALGFIVTDETHPYKPGLRNRFLSLGLEYVEWVWVENEAAFNAGGAEEFARMFPNLSAFRQAARPFSIGWQTENVNTLHDEWTARGYSLPDVWSFAPPGMPPILSFQVIPTDLLPGVSNFAITYHGSTPSGVRRVRIAPNSVYAVEGITLVSDTPAENAARWQALLNPAASVQPHNDVYAVDLPPHTTRWMTTPTFEARYGLNWTNAPHDSGDLAAIHLLAENLDNAAAKLGQNARPQEAADTHEPLLVVAPDSRDGLTFIIRQYPPEKWRTERESITGEKIALS